MTKFQLAIKLLKFGQIQPKSIKIDSDKIYLADFHFLIGLEFWPIKTCSIRAIDPKYLRRKITTMKHSKKYVFVKSFTVLELLIKSGCSQNALAFFKKYRY